MINGLYEFRKSFTGLYWLELFLLGVITGLPVPVREIAELAGRIGPDQVHLNTVVRPPAERFAVPVPQYFMESFVASCGGNAEVIHDCKNPPHGDYGSGTSQEVLALVSRRPSTLKDIVASLGLGRTETSRFIDQLSSAGLLETKYQGRRLYFRAASPLAK